VIPEELVVVSATLINPFPWTSDVTSTEDHCPLVSAPEEPVIVPEDEGAFW